jgi:hypothetical protein
MSALAPEPDAPPVMHLREEFWMGMQIRLAMVSGGLRDAFLFRVAAARRCFSLLPWFLTKLLRILESDEAYQPTETD